MQNSTVAPLLIALLLIQNACRAMQESTRLIPSTAQLLEEQCILKEQKKRRECMQLTLLCCCLASAGLVTTTGVGLLTALVSDISWKQSYCAFGSDLAMLRGTASVIRPLSDPVGRCVTQRSLFPFKLCNDTKIDDKCFTEYEGQPYVAFVMNRHCDLLDDLGWPGNNITEQFLPSRNNKDVLWLNLKQTPFSLQYQKWPTVLLINAKAKNTFAQAAKKLYEVPFGHNNHCHYFFWENFLYGRVNEKYYVRNKEKKIWGVTNKQLNNQPRHEKELTALNRNRHKLNRR